MNLPTLSQEELTMAEKLFSLLGLSNISLEEILHNPNSAKVNQPKPLKHSLKEKEYILQVTHTCETCSKTETTLHLMSQVGHTSVLISTPISSLIEGKKVQKESKTHITCPHCRAYFSTFSQTDLITLLLKEKNKQTYTPKLNGFKEAEKTFQALHPAKLRKELPK